MRIFRIGAVVMCSSLLAACYELSPAGAAPPVPGSAMAFDINDVGRVGLGGQMGPEIAQVEGQLMQDDAAEYLVAVSNVKFLRGGEQTWRGEKIRIKHEYVTTLYERRFSRSRTLAVAAVGVGIVALIAGRSILGTGGEDPLPLPHDTASSVRIPRH